MLHITQKGIHFMTKKWDIKWRHTKKYVGIILLPLLLLSTAGHASGNIAAINIMRSALNSNIDATVGSEENIIDLPSHLDEQWPDGNYHLSTSSIAVYDSSFVPRPNAAYGKDDVIYYTPPLELGSGIEYISYTLTTGTPAEDLTGIIVVSLQEPENRAPLITPVNYTYSTPVTMYEEITLNLENMEGLTIVDPENAHWELYMVASETANVEKRDRNSFTFVADEPGKHNVSYLVEDDERKPSLGTIQITVESLEKPKDWYDITMDKLTFEATPLYSEVYNSGFITAGLWDAATNGGTGDTIAGLTDSAASGYCATHGKRLPTEAEMTTLFSNSDVAIERNKYPKAHLYLATNGSQTVIYNLANGTVSTYPANPGSDYYVTCAQAATVTSIRITPESIDMMTEGEQQQFSAIATYDDGSTDDISSVASWNINGQIATVAGGKVTILSAAIGEATLSASSKGMDSNVVKLVSSICIGVSCYTHHRDNPNYSYASVSCMNLTLWGFDDWSLTSDGQLSSELYARYPNNQMNTHWGWPTNRDYWTYNIVNTYIETVNLSSGKITPHIIDSAGTMNTACRRVRALPSHSG